MGKRESYAPGTFSWVELSTPDVGAAKSFYAELFGWSYEDNPVPGGGTYTMCAVGSDRVGAMMEMRSEQQEQGVPPHWLNYVTVESADAATERAKGLGANVFAE